MKNTFTINGHDVTFTACTAVFEGTRQLALHIHDEADEYANGDGVRRIDSLDEFPECADDARQLLEEFWDTDYETLETVQF